MAPDKAELVITLEFNNCFCRNKLYRNSHHVQKTGTRLLISVLLITEKKRKKLPKYLSTREQMNKP
jgi:hypothetical protein